jgi:hypothetical protein
MVKMRPKTRLKTNITVMKSLSKVIKKEILIINNRNSLNILADRLLKMRILKEICRTYTTRLRLLGNLGKNRFPDG